MFPLAGGAGGTAALEAAEERDVFKAGLGIPPLPTVLHPSPSVPSAVVFPLAAGVSTATGGGTGGAGRFKTSCPPEVTLLEGLSSSSSEEIETLLLLMFTFREVSSMFSISLDVEDCWLFKHSLSYLFAAACVVGIAQEVVADEQRTAAAASTDL